MPAAVEVVSITRLVHWREDEALQRIRAAGRFGVREASSEPPTPDSAWIRRFDVGADLRAWLVEQGYEEPRDYWIGEWRRSEATVGGAP